MNTYTQDLHHVGVFEKALAPQIVSVTFEGACNLQCKHCFWDSDVSRNSRDWEVWSRNIDQLIQWDAHVLYAGRILTRDGARFITEYCARSGKKVGMIDNGYTILKFPELFDLYEYVNISIDGVEEDHDSQRGRVGSSKMAWTAIHALKKAGLDPIVSNVISPINIGRWNEFEAMLYDTDTPLSCTPVLGVRGNKERMPLFSNTELLRAFETVLKGVPKLIQILDPKHIEVLLPLLKTLEWEYGKNAYQAEFQNIIVKYRPFSIDTLVERNLSWNGKFYVGMDSGNSVFDKEADEARVLKVANNFANKEHKLVKELVR